jgi:hypothetical protein
VTSYVAASSPEVSVDWVIDRVIGSLSLVLIVAPRLFSGVVWT